MNTRAIVTVTDIRSGMARVDIMLPCQIQDGPTLKFLKNAPNEYKLGEYIGTKIAESGSQTSLNLYLLQTGNF